MIALIEGSVEEKSPGRAIINVNGIGYEVFVNDNSLSVLQQGETVKMYVREQIKEDAFDLYGFISTSEKELFEKLLSVKNVGPRVAMAVLNIGSAETVRQAIAGGDTKMLQSAKGVGRRAAEQIVVELRDKVGLSASTEAEAIVNRSGFGGGDEAAEALISLGYSTADANMALNGVDPSLSVEERIKQALKVKGGGK
jgi:Holliday junction DNA helicase RuvA